MTEYGIRFGFCSSARALNLSNSPPVGNFSTSTAAATALAPLAHWQASRSHTWPPKSRLPDPRSPHAGNERDRAARRDAPARQDAPCHPHHRAPRLHAWERACAVGALAVVEKPYVAAEILNKVREALGQTKIPSV